jgi:hypothetical protein
MADTSATHHFIVKQDVGWAEPTAKSITRSAAPPVFQSALALSNRMENSKYFRVINLQKVVTKSIQTGNYKILTIC